LWQILLKQIPISPEGVLETEFIMHENSTAAEKAILIGVHTGFGNILEDTTDESMAELAELAETAGAVVVGEMVQNRSQADKAAYVGEGKLEEILNAASTLDADLVIADSELSGSQLRNLEKYLNIRVIDRSTLILDIFASRALSSEGKLQVELAQLKYNLPRLTGKYTALSRLGGGIGTRGPGETKLESDRRHIRGRIHALEKEIAEISGRRGLIRNRRKKNKVPTAALVGYTNTGKSTLLNLLTGSDVFAESMLFATLDPTARALTLPDGRQSVIIDTVGFIRKLPHHLIDAFKSTLEEAVYADVLIHVVDSSSSQMENQQKVVSGLLEQLGANNKPIVTVFNKCDISGMKGQLSPSDEPFVCMSAKTGQGADELINLLNDTLPGKRINARLLIPYEKGHITSALRLSNALVSEAFTPNGILIEFMADAAAYDKYKPYLLKEE
jgi:GTP-binding protein HflX